MARVLPAEWRGNLAWLCPASDPTITRNLTPWEKFVFAHTASEKSVSGVSRWVAEHGDRATIPTALRRVAADRAGAVWVCVRVRAVRWRGRECAPRQTRR